MFRSAPMTLTVIAATVALASGVSRAALTITSGAVKTITFDENVGNQGGATDSTSVFKLDPNGTENTLRIGEPNGWAWQGDAGNAVLSSHSWHFVGPDNSQTNPFTADADNNGSSGDRFDSFQISRINSSVLPALGAGNKAYEIAGSWQDKLVTLQVRNLTGATVNTWNLSVDTWFNDKGSNGMLSLRYGSSFTGAGSVEATTLLGGVVGSVASTNANTGWSGLNTIGGAVNQTVADGGVFYVQLFYDQNGDGNAFAFDNLSVQAVQDAAPVPEPTSLALVTMVAAGLATRRRRVAVA